MDISSKGGRARAKTLTAEQRKSIASKAASMRWAKIPSAMQSSAETPPSSANGESLPPSPFAKFRGDLNLGGAAVEVYVLDTGQRIISLATAVRAIADREGGNLGEYLGVSSLKPFIDKELVLGEAIDFHIPGTQFRGRGITAERFLDMCQGYVAALQAGALSTDRQREIAIRCSVLLASCAKVGLIALIDEVTGYQYERAEDALQVKLHAFIAEELRAWEKTFPDELWEQFGRLTKWQGTLHRRPKWWGHLVIELVYEALDPDIAKYLKENKPKPFHGKNYHQWLTEDFGLKALISHIYEIIGIAKTCTDMRELRDKVALLYGREPVQLTLMLPKRPSN